MVIEENEGGRDDEKYLIHIKRWQSYMSKKQSLIKSGHSVKVSGYYGVKVLW